MAPAYKMPRQHVENLCRALIIAAFSASIYAPVAAGQLSCPSGSGIFKGSCDLCPVGTYSLGGTNAVCKRCPDGTTSPLASAFLSQCYKCKDNFAGTGGKCKRCPKGKYAPAIGGKVCSTCKKLKGTLYPQVDCRDYLVCSPNITAIFKRCPFNTCFSNKKQCCVDRIDGVTCKEKVKATCMPGTGINKNFICTYCPTGYYNPGKWIKCKPCPPGHTDFLGSTTCRKCFMGEYSPGGAACKSCPKGTYNNKPGSTSCKKCTKRTLVPDLRFFPKSCSAYVVCSPKAVMTNKFCLGPSGTCFIPAKQCCKGGTDGDRCR